MDYQIITCQRCGYKFPMNLNEYIKEVREEAKKKDWFFAIDYHVDDSLTGSCLSFLEAKLRECAEKTADAVEIQKSIPEQAEVIARLSETSQIIIRMRESGYDNAVVNQRSKRAEWMGDKGI